MGFELTPALPTLTLSRMRPTWPDGIARRTCKMTFASDVTPKKEAIGRSTVAKSKFSVASPELTTARTVATNGCCAQTSDEKAVLPGGRNTSRYAVPG